MEGSDKSDEGIFKSTVCNMSDLCHSSRTRKIFLIDLNYSPMHTVISISLILDYCRLSYPDKGSLALGADTPPCYTLSLKACNHIGHGPVVYPLH